MDFADLKEKSRKLRRETYALYLAARHRKMPWYAKLIVAFTVAYALSPIDLIPDFIPVLGYLDDLILVPLGIALALKFIPEEVMEECRNQAEILFRTKKPVSIAGAIFVAIIWVACVWWLGSVLYKLLV